MFAQISQFMDAGGEVLYLIAVLTFLMWTLIFERLWYFHTALKHDVSAAQAAWEGRNERKSWHAKQIRRQLISVVSLSINQNMPMIRTMVALCPLFGLLGTVWGMIEVFNIMAVTGGGDAKAMAGGVSKATIPTMAGMVAALSGVFANTILTRISERETLLLEDSLVMDH
ncbi:Biopolymer transport protein ExbB [BD1-7 clade bacterium]|uniref:Biopolymer transport protein ExbB n=1 Tax=BD1-7 clade bacterium TaxID=2029982 RepID=A0A5S9MVY6_9GAMM|nr:Biopolymer transport protein ExbB [BD1-7 clade bacterium]CAA0080847.1 Biopolymer transport protein ExbB [BD1-7 clade bacterium]